MLVRETKRLVLFVVPVLVLIYVALRLCFDQPALPASLGDWFGSNFSPSTDEKAHQTTSENTQLSLPAGSPSAGTGSVGSEGINDDPLAANNEVFSVSTKDRKFFPIKFGDTKALNPNIIPHPLLDNTWIIVAQQHKTLEESHVWFAELVCNAVFVSDVLQCAEPPTILPIAATVGERCTGDLVFMAWNIGPHDARVFFGPKVPYAVYGSNSQHTCFGQWIQDLRVLVPWGLDMVKENRFRLGTELQRPAPWGQVEKNWFVFWDKDEQAFVHHDVSPQRVFAKLGDDGSVGPDIAPLARPSDDLCMARYMPQPNIELESLHQATNSLSITLCKRSDPSCEPGKDDNTVIFTLFQHKTYYDFHSVYWPYVMAFRQRAPFELYGISKKPIYIHGRETTWGTEGLTGSNYSEVRSQMFYVTSMSWKARGQKYHGYLDDVMFLAFGIEDRESGGIDVVAGDLFRGLGLCE